MAISLTLILPFPAQCDLKKNDVVSTPLIYRVPTNAQEVGDTRSFWAYDFDAEEMYIVDAHLLAIGDHCYIYFDDLATAIIGEETASTRAETYRDEFDSNIYQRVTDLAGNPNGTLGDIDGDPRVYILIVEHRQSYYRQTNEGPGEYSNLCEMIYVCYRTSNPIRTITHEFHHLVWFNYEFDEVHFILEGGAEYSTYYAGYLPDDNMTVRARPFLEDIHDSFIYFEVEAQDYGACYLFAFYLAEQYGVQFLRDLVQHEGDGALGLETALRDAGHNISFNELYMDWMTALTIDEQGFANDRYCLRDIDATIQDCTTIRSLPYQDGSVSLYCYGSMVYRILSPPDRFCIEMSQPTEGVAGLSVAYRDAYGWHVQQMQNQGRAIMIVSGQCIEAAYFIASHLYANVPTGDIDFGPGVQRTVQIMVYEDERPTTVTSSAASPIQTPTTPTDPPPPIPIELMALVLGAFSPVIVLFLIAIRVRKGSWK